MEIKDILSIVSKLEEILKDNFIISKYDQLINSINQRRPYQEIRSFISEINDFNIKNDFSDIYFFKEKEVADKLGIYNLFGENANLSVQEYLLDLDTASRNIDELKQKIVSLKNNLSAIKQNLDILNINVQEEEINIIEFVFDGKEKIETIDDLQKRTRDLPKNIKGLARLTEESGKEPEIIHISKNSPTIIQMVLASGAVLKVINKVVKEILDRILQVQEIKKNQLEIEKRGIENQKIKEGFEEEISKIKENFDKNLAEKLYNEYNPSSSSGSKSEVITAVQNAIKNLNTYIERGGSVNIKILPEPTEDGSIAQIDLREIPMNRYILLQKNEEEIKKLESPKINFNKKEDKEE